VGLGKSHGVASLQDRRVGIPHFKAPPTRDCLQDGYVTRYVPIAHHTLPAIAPTGRIFESCDIWVDSRMANDDPHEGPCDNPGIYTFELLTDCNKYCVATDILGDGFTYMNIVEVQVLGGNMTATQPTMKKCPRGVFYDDHCLITSLYIRQCELRATKNSGALWGDIGQSARERPIIANDLWMSRASRSQQQARMRRGQPPVKPDSKRGVAETTRNQVIEHFLAIASTPSRPPPFSEIIDEMDVEGDVSMDEDEYNPWGGYGDVPLSPATSIAPVA
jgi:hypothetical protein